VVVSGSLVIVMRSALSIKQQTRRRGHVVQAQVTRDHLGADEDASAVEG
jgi:hypothetical protein